MMTKSQLSRINRDWTEYAGETITAQQIGSGIYAFCSELATLRLLKKYRDCKDAKQGLTGDKSSFYFVLELRF